MSTEEDSPYMLFEYMEYGDLANLLRRNDPSLGKDSPIELKEVGAYLSHWARSFWEVPPAFSHILGFIFFSEVLLCRIGPE